MMTIFIVLVIAIFAAPTVVMLLGWVAWANGKVIEMENDDELYLIR